MYLSTIWTTKYENRSDIMGFFLACDIINSFINIINSFICSKPVFLYSSLPTYFSDI